MSNTDKQIGWVLFPLFNPLPGSISTRAFIHCFVCGGTIATSNGPLQKAICLTCVEAGLERRPPE